MLTEHERRCIQDVMDRLGLHQDNKTKDNMQDDGQLAAAIIAQLVAKLDSMAPDNERYKWLRDKSQWHRVDPPSASLQGGHGVKVIYQHCGMDDNSKPRIFMNGVFLDTYIDGIIEKEKNDE